MRIHLCTPYYGARNAERQAELDACLKGNVENPHIDRITLFVDDGSKPPFGHEKLRIVDVAGRLTYRHWLDFSLKASEPEISVLSNAGIMFDETIAQLLKLFKQKKRFVALSRHEKSAEGLVRHPAPKSSQDVWAIRTDDEVTAEFRRAADFVLGAPRCDNKIVYEAAVHGWDVINPFPAVRAIRSQASQASGPGRALDQMLIGGMGYVHPCANVMGQSTVDLSVWPLKTGNIKSVRVIRALEDASLNAHPSAAKGAESIIAYDANWQYPAITEKHALDQMRLLQRLVPDDGLYVGFPWATLIDKLVNRPAEAEGLLRELEQLKPKLAGRKRVATVCQHIHMMRFQDLFAQAGVTDIFWSHKVLGQDYLPDHPNVTLHAFPLYPVQVDDDEGAGGGERRRFLFSFVGARARAFYLTQVRTYILEELSDYPSGHIVGRGDWHYNKIVYDHQILGRSKTTDGLVNDQASLEFVETLKLSDFSLCPSGSGPNSIRLWESIGAGAIPVIMADTLDLPGPRALWEQAAVFCAEDRDAVQALPARLESIAADEELMRQMRHAGRQLWLLYGPKTFVQDVMELFVTEMGGDSVAGEANLFFSDTQLIGLAREALKPKEEPAETDLFLLLTAASHSLLRPKSFLRLCNRHEVMGKGLNAALERCDGEEPADAWRRAEETLKSVGDTGDRALCDPILSVMTAGRNANRSPLAYSSYRAIFSNRLQFVEEAALADLMVFAASQNITEIHRASGKKTLLDKSLVVLSEEPLWDTTWSLEFDAPMGRIMCGDIEFDYAILNHLTTDIYKFERIPYFVTTEDKYPARYAQLFRRNAAMSPQQLLDLWRAAPIRQAYFAEKRVGDRYDLQRPEFDLYGYCAYRTRLAEAARGDGILKVGQGWSDAARRQELPDWHLDKLATLDQRTFICSALENTHLPDYITEKPFDAFAVLAVPVYAASARHRVTEIVPEEAFINIFGLDAQEAAEKLAAFEPDIEYAERYLEAQRRLADLFSDVKILRAERRRVVNETVAALDAVRSGEFAGRRAATSPYASEAVSAG